MECAIEEQAVKTGAARIHSVASSQIPTEWGTFVAHSVVDTLGKEHLILTMGMVGDGEPVLVRIHSECLTGDALSSLRCDCGFQLRAAMQKIGRAGRGVVLYLRQEGRGIGLHNKIRAYGLQDEGADTVDANLRLGLAADARDYAICKPMLERIGVRRVLLMTNNPAKVGALRELGFAEVERVALAAARNRHNAAYLDAKESRMGHLVGDRRR